MGRGVQEDQGQPGMDSAALHNMHLSRPGRPPSHTLKASAAAEQIGFAARDLVVGLADLACLIVPISTILGTQITSS